MDHGSMLNDGDQACEAGCVGQNINDVGDKEIAKEGTDGNENKQGDEEDQEELEAIIRKQLER